MHKIVYSSTPGAIERDEAINLLTMRAVLTRMVCREASECNGKFLYRRTGTALGLLGRWLADNWPAEDYLLGQRYSTLNPAFVPDDCQDLAEEIIDGGLVCDGIRMIQTSDNDTEFDSDSFRINEALKNYWEKHSKPSEH